MYSCDMWIKWFSIAPLQRMVLYLDNMDFGPLNHIHLPMPHVCCYEDRLLRQLIEADKWPWNFFGQSKPRNARSVCYSRGVRMKAPTNQTNADEGCSDSRKDQLSLEVVTSLCLAFKNSVSKALDQAIESQHKVLVENIIRLLN